MDDTFIRIKAIIRQEDKYLILEHWMDDRIVDPFVWEFVDCDLEHGESPVQAALRGIYDAIGVDGRVIRPLYTWSQMIGDLQCVGIAFLCELKEDGPSLMLSDEYSGFEWVTGDELSAYIQNQNMLEDILHSDISVP